MMQLNSHPQEVISYDSLAEVKGLVTPQLIKRTYEDICSQYKEIAHKLVYLLNTFKAQDVKYHEKYQSTADLLRIVEIITKSTEFEKYGHMFPLFQYLVNRFKILRPEKFMKIDQQIFINRIHLNENSMRYKYLRQSPINWGNAQNGSLFFHQFNQIQSSFNDPACICCSKVFIKDSQIVNKNPQFSNMTIIDLTPQINYIELANYISVLANKNGGALLVGLKKKDDCLTATGISYKMREDLKRKQNMIHKAVAIIRPKLNYYTQYVMIKKNHFEDCQGSLIDMVCFRVIIFPPLKKRISYINVPKNNENIYYFCREEDQSAKKKQLKQFWERQRIPKQFYQQIYNKYNQKINLVSVHPNIKCYHPYHVHRELLQDKTHVFDHDQEISDIQQIKFVYRKSSLIVLPSDKYEKYLKLFYTQLQQTGHYVHLSTPYKQYLGKSGLNKRPVWMLSHQISVMQIKKQLNIFLQTQQIQQKSFKLMSIQRILQIESDKIPSQKLIKLLQVFRQKFHRSINVKILKAEISKQVKKQIVNMYFNCFQQAIFAYIVMQDLQVRPYFVKEGAVYKKKDQ